MYALACAAFVGMLSLEVCVSGRPVNEHEHDDKRWVSTSLSPSTCSNGRHTASPELSPLLRQPVDTGNGIAVRNGIGMVGCWLSRRTRGRRSPHTLSFFSPCTPFSLSLCRFVCRSVCLSGLSLFFCHSVSASMYLWFGYVSVPRTPFPLFISFSLPLISLPPPPLSASPCKSPFSSLLCISLSLQAEAGTSKSPDHASSGDGLVQVADDTGEQRSEKVIVLVLLFGLVSHSVLAGLVREAGHGVREVQATTFHNKAVLLQILNWLISPCLPVCLPLS